MKPIFVITIDALIEYIGVGVMILIIVGCAMWIYVRECIRRRKKK